MADKKNIIIIVIISVFIIIGGSYCFSIKNIKNISTSFESNEEVLSLDDSSFISLLNKIDSYIYLVDRKEGYNSFSALELFTIGSNNLDDNSFVPSNNNYTLDKNIILNELYKYFPKSIDFRDYDLIGNSISIPKVSFENGNYMSINGFDKNTLKYNVSFSKSTVDDGIGAKTKLLKITDAFKKSDKIYVKEKAIYLDEIINGDTVKYKVYSDNTMTNLIDTINYDLVDSSNHTINVNDYLDDASTITVTLEKNENDKYVFESSIIE